MRTPHCIAALGLAFLAAARAETRFVGAPTNDVFNAIYWDNGLPSVARGNGVIASNGIYGAALDFNEPAPGPVTVAHVAGSLTPTAIDWNVRNDAAGGAAYAWNQSGGNLSTRLLTANNRVAYTLSGAGTLTASAGGARIYPQGSGTFRQTGGTLVNMGVEAGNGTTVELTRGAAMGCGAQIPSQALWAHGSAASQIAIGAHHSIAFAPAVLAAGAVLLQDGAALAFDSAWLGAWTRDSFTAADWATALTDPGIRVGATPVTAANFADLFVVGRAGAVGSCVQLRSRANPPAPALPAIASARLSAHFDASDMHGDGGATDPGSQGKVQVWVDRVSGGAMIKDVPPAFVVAGDGGIGGRDTVRFSASATGGDLVFGNALTFTGQTIFAVATMATNQSTALSTLLCNAHAGLNIRQTTTEAPAYFSGNSGDFVVYDSAAAAGGTFAINGSRRLDIPGGFGAPHVLKAERTAPAAFSGIRFSDNIRPERRWNGDIAEVLVYDATLSGDDTLRVQRYLTEKYGVAFHTALDERLDESAKIAVDPFGTGGNRRVAVNFHYAGPTADGAFRGIRFDNIDCSGWIPPAGPFALTANPGAAGAMLTLDCPFPVDNTPRNQSAAVQGVDSNVLDTVANEFFYVGTSHPAAAMTFAGLSTAKDVFVQIVGGDAGWNGDVRVRVNGAEDVDWLGAADGAAAGTASLMGFYARTDAAGSLRLDFTVPAGNFAGIAGVIVIESTPRLTGTTVIVR